MTAIINDIVVSGNPEEIKELIDLNQSQHKHVIVDDRCVHGVPDCRGCHEHCLEVSDEGKN